MEGNCEICGIRPAEVLYIEVNRQGVVIKRACRICAERESAGITTLHTVNDVVADLSCPSCGTKFSSVKKNLKAGCPVCYTTMRKEIEKLLKNVQGSSKYSGYHLHKDEELKELLRAAENLRKELKTAVDTENFEQAATLRDRLNRIKVKIKWMNGENQ